MDPTVFGVLAGLSSLSLLGVWSAARREKRRELRLEAMGEIALAVDLVDVVLEEAAVSGKHGGLRVRIETSWVARVRPVGRIVIDGLARGFAIQRDGLLARVEQARGAPRVETGDEAFDEAIHVRGVPATARALLDAETRAQVIAAVCGRPLGRDAIVSVADGALTGELGGEWSEDAGQLAVGVRVLLALALRLRETDTELERLAQVARVDRVRRVRVLALEALVDAAPGHAVTETALRRGCVDRDPEVRFRAALLADGNAGRQALHALAADHAVPDELSAAAVEELGASLSSDVLRDIIASAPRGRPKTDLAAVRALAKGGPGVAAAIVAAFPRFEDDAAATAAGVLQAIAARDAEDALLAAAARPGPAVRVAVARALGALGSVRAVPVLRELEGDGGAVLRAAREAVVAIQSRLHGASSGQVALADGGAGELSLADADGRVSLDRRND